MLSKVISASYLGVEGYLIQVEVDISRGLPAFELVGLPNAAVREARERVRAALRNSPYPFPTKRITINLAPADIPKQGSYLDLPIATGILAAQQIIPNDYLTKYAVLGELSLDGQVQPVKGVLAMALTCKEAGLKGMILPQDNYLEASAVTGLKLIPISHINELVAFLRYGEFNPPDIPSKRNRRRSGVDLATIKGQTFAKRGLEIAAAGNHNMLMVGPPGSGKTLLAKALPSILPPLIDREALEVMRIHSIVGLAKKERGLIREPPFRQPHTNITAAALIGGGRIPVPGEISLAHHGVLFLDEMTEFHSRILDQLRQPLEQGQIIITRNQHRLTFPARFIFIGATNPCKCGYYGDPSGKCRCTPNMVKRYFERISGPFKDRIDLQIQTFRVDATELFSSSQGESSRIVRERVIQAREVQRERFKDSNIKVNSQIPPDKIKSYCPLTTDGQKILTMALDRLELTARGCHQIIKVARTLADLRQVKIIEDYDIKEAIQYRSLPRLYK